MTTWKQTAKIIAGGALASLLISPVVWAAQASSTHYQVNEVFFGSGGQLNACSTTFCAKQALGETVVGNTKSDHFQAQGGFDTDRTPYIEFSVGTVNLNLGNLSATAPTVANATFTVKAYLAHGYAVYNASPPPTNGSYQLASLTTPTPSIAGTEQFGMNLRQNSQPTSFGDDPQYIPDSTFSFGKVADNYNQPDLYMYADSGADSEIAYSDSSSSDTTYTISYIFNISHVTPGGTYVMHHVLVATATY
ncbi:MAG TPA: hypothetical protein VG992_02750 [Candidatus Saccharimonadales bacterium]|nr:hypothetical protein [Candidatus Saccharimonadales bacterium]